MPGYQRGLWGFTVGFHAFKANTSLTEPSPQPSDSFEAVTYPEMHRELRAKGSFQIVGQGMAEMPFKHRAPMLRSRSCHALLVYLRESTCVSFALPSAGRGKIEHLSLVIAIGGCGGITATSREMVCSRVPSSPVFMDAFGGYVKCPFPPQPTVFSADLRLLSLAEPHCAVSSAG